MTRYKKYFLGETLGTFILVFIGCSSVAISVTGIGLSSLPKVALLWWLAVTLGIWSSMKWSPAHLNPAVTLAIHSVNKFKRTDLLAILTGQFFGALLAGLMILFVFESSISQFESLSNLVRGEEGSYKSAVMFGEFYPNPGFEDSHEVSVWKACIMEGIGVMLLMVVIIITNHIKRNKRFLQPLLIGLSICLLIIWIAPYTQAGFNPFRDFAPRIVAYFAGWKEYAFPKEPLGAFYVYILSPIIASVFTMQIHRLIYKNVD